MRRAVALPTPWPVDPMLVTSDFSDLMSAGSMTITLDQWTTVTLNSGVGYLFQNVLNVYDRARSKD
jgi:hypothetical protein